MRLKVGRGFSFYKGVYQSSDILFDYLQEFYMPSQPHSLTFIQQCVQDTFQSPCDVGSSQMTAGHSHNHVASADTLYNSHIPIVTPVNIAYEAQMTNSLLHLAARPTHLSI
jgi:hypothetical protein